MKHIVDTCVDSLHDVEVVENHSDYSTDEMTDCISNIRGVIIVWKITSTVPWCIVYHSCRQTRMTSDDDDDE